VSGNPGSEFLEGNSVYPSQVFTGLWFQLDFDLICGSIPKQCLTILDPSIWIWFAQPRHLQAVDSAIPMLCNMDNLGVIACRAFCLIGRFP
jgi:hypothetical protein